MKYINIAKDYHDQYGFNVIPVKDKVPQVNWKDWQEKEMTNYDLEMFDWNSKTNGIGAINGIGNLRCLDFDKASSFELIEKFLKDLEVPEDYGWVVKSGSGYHIWFTAETDSELLNEIGGVKSRHDFRPINPNHCDHVELRWSNSMTVLPLSQHPNGTTYAFLFSPGLPESAPLTIKLKTLINAMTENLIVERKRESTTSYKNDTDHVNKEELRAAVATMKGKINNYDDFFKIGFALASLGEMGRELFLDIGTNNPKYETDNIDSLNTKFNSLLRDYRGDIKIGTFFEIAKKYGYKRSYSTFWFENKNGEIVIKRNLFFDLLEKAGFGKYFLDDGYIFIRIQDKIIKEVKPVHIKDYVLEYVAQLDDNRLSVRVKESLLKSVNSLFSEAALECLKTVEPIFNTDDKQHAHFFFSNGVLVVSDSEAILKPHSELEACVWEDQIIKRNFTPTESKSNFETFIANVSRQDLNRINALKSAVGYLLHRYKDPTVARAIIFMDEKLSENAFGRTGKGLVAKAIEELRRLVKVDGRNFRFDKNFAFQSVNIDTQIIFFDDVNKKFDFEKLFSIITDGMTIEKKNRDEFRIPFNRSPKILITTNHSISGNDDSSQARQFVFEFSDCYNKNHQPINDFQKMFFIEWESDDWNAFYNYMIKCAQLYLKNGLMKYDYINLDKKKLIDSTNPEFEEFITGVSLEVKHNKKELFQDFTHRYLDYGQLKQNTFTRWINIYANLYNIQIEEQKSGADRFIILRKRQ